MNIEKVNGLWVPSNDIHIDDWKSGKPFTQNKCLDSFLIWINSQNRKFKTVIDIGAWCGTWSLALSQYSKKIYAFEPDKIHFECLQKNVAPHVHIEPVRSAIGEVERRISLTDDDFTQAKRIHGDGDIAMRTLDQRGYENVDLVKIDVEGYEMKVLQGAEKTLKTCQFLMIELNNNTKKYGSSNLEVEQYLESKGFRTLINVWPDKVFVNNNI